MCLAMAAVAPQPSEVLKNKVPRKSLSVGEQINLMTVQENPLAPQSPPSRRRQQQLLPGGRRCQTTVNLTKYETEGGGLRTTTNVTNAFKHTCTNTETPAGSTGGSGGRVSLSVSVYGSAPPDGNPEMIQRQCNGDKYFRESEGHCNESDEEVIASNVLPDIVNHLLANSVASESAAAATAASSLRSSSTQHNKPYLTADSGGKHNEQHNLEVLMLLSRASSTVIMFFQSSSPSTLMAETMIV